MPLRRFRIGALALTTLLPLAAQSGPVKSFEVASIKPSTPQVVGYGHSSHAVIGPRFGPGTPDPTRWACDACPLALLVSEAYGLKRFQITGPKWLDSERFDILARVPQGATVADLRLMLQSLLAERFAFKAHTDQKEMQGFELLPAKGGPKLKPAAEAGADTAPQPDRAGHGRSIGNWGGHATGRTSTFTMHGNTRHNAVAEDMAAFAGFLASQLERPVTDSTGLTGKFDFVLNFSSVKQADSMPIAHGGGHADSPDAEAPPLPKALQDQLGLRLEPRKGSAGLLIIDHLEKAPTAN